MYFIKKKKKKNASLFIKMDHVPGFGTAENAAAMR